jgi:branched-chain amino acid transport system substrate-binding protein
MVLSSCAGSGSSATTTVGPSTTLFNFDPPTVAPPSVAPGESTSVPAAPAGWSVDTSSCVDPARAEQPIEGEVKVGSVMPLSGGPAAAFQPVVDGFKLYLSYADEHGLLPGFALSADIRDDQYDSTQTAGVVDGLIDDGVDLFAGMIGTPNNLAARDVLNEECIPQLLALTGSPAWGEAADYPWTTGALVPYGIEASIYATKLSELQPNAKVATYSVANEFGQTYVDAFKAKAAELGLEIVDEQTIEPDAVDPPTAQVGSIAGKKPDAVVAFPLGLQCPAFLTELDAARAQNQGWTPVVFVTNTCASKLFFGLAGPAGDGVYTSNHLFDVNDPRHASQPGVKTFLNEYATAAIPGDPAVIEAGWTVGELTVAILVEALKSGTLSRKSIIEAARTMTYTPMLARPSVQYKMRGVDDVYAFQTLQVLQWNVDSQTFTEAGDPIAAFES